MPYRSIKQEKFFHTDTAKKKGITGDIIRDWDNASRGMKLPDRAKKKKGK
jgi:hypothetical protein